MKAARFSTAVSMMAVLTAVPAALAGKLCLSCSGRPGRFRRRAPESNPVRIAALRTASNRRTQSVRFGMVPATVG